MKEQVLAVQRMQDYIEKNKTEEISLSDLARASLFSPWYSYRLVRFFHRERQVSVTDPAGNTRVLWTTGG